MNIIDGNFSDKKERSTTLEKLQSAIDGMQISEADADTEFALVVFNPDGYTTVGTSMSIMETVFMLEAAKMGLMTGDPEDSTTLQQEVTMSGKGSSPRPIPNPETFDNNWDAIFGKANVKDHSDEDIEKEKKSKKVKK